LARQYGSTHIRSKVEQYVAVLYSCYHKPLVITHIVYNANLNCNIVVEIIADLQKNGFLEKIYNVKTYKGYRIGYMTTDLGKQLVDSYMSFFSYLHCTSKFRGTSCVDTILFQYNFKYKKNTVPRRSSLEKCKVNKNI